MDDIGLSGNGQDGWMELGGMFFSFKSLDLEGFTGVIKPAQYVGGGREVVREVVNGARRCAF
jgi:hypothetical protein